MDYALAKRLKDAGFPGITNAWFDDESNGASSAPVKGWEMRYFLPTLSELIEACGAWPRQFSLYGRDKNRWEATLVGNAEPHGAKMIPSLTEYGTTPEQAVAMLWLVLHEPKEG